MPVLQAVRYDEILHNRVAQAESIGINGEFMKNILEAIHEESVRVQLDLMNKQS
jgi:chorismate mutase